MFRPSGRGPLALAMLAVLGLLAATAGAHTLLNNRTGATRFGSVRICTYENFSRRLDRCTRDQRGQTLASSRIVCSTTVHTTSFETSIRAQWRYEGVAASAFKAVLSDGDTYWIDWNLGAGFPLPGGTYLCRFSSGKTTVTARAISSGPTGPIIDTTICDERNTRRYGTDKSFYVCLRDQDGTTIAAGSSIVCNAVYPNVSGHTKTVQVVNDAGVDVAPPSENIVSGLLTQTQKRYGPITSVGRYRCLFSLDHNLVTEKSIVVQ